MKKKLEQLIIFLIPAILIEKVLKTFNNVFYRSLNDDAKFFEHVLNKFPLFTPGEVVTTLNILDSLFSVLPMLILAAWIWRFERSENGRPYLWALGAIFINYWILLLYIGQHIYMRLESRNQK